MSRCTCNAIGCRAQILPSELFCGNHLRMVESDTRRVLGRTFRPGRKYQSNVFRETLALALREVLYFQTEGHRMPKDRPFEWDDERAEQLAPAKESL